jgi:uncharacterized membrane protein YphA (DoxX/SURF4 family)
MAKKGTVSRRKAAAAAPFTVRVDGLLVLQVCVALFVFTLGLMLLVGWNWNPSRLEQAVARAIGRPQNPVNLAVGIAELVAGVLLLAVPFVPVKKRLLFWTTLAVGIAWVVRIILVQFAYSDFDPFLDWLNGLARDLVVLAALWLINRKYA